MKKLIVALSLVSLAGVANAACYGSGNSYTCTDQTGSRYSVQKYGNTTAASVPIALCEAWEAGAVKEGDLVCLAAFGSGFTWGSALIRW